MILFEACFALSGLSLCAMQLTQGVAQRNFKEISVG